LAWENSDAVVGRDPKEFSCYDLMNDKDHMGYAIVKNSNQSLIQFGLKENDYTRYGDSLFSKIHNKHPKYKIINIDERDRKTIEYFIKNNFEQLVSQYSMEVKL
jgi:hypothetical protein